MANSDNETVLATGVIQREDGFLPLSLYGALGDGRSVAIVGADGSIDWWCVPSMDCPPVFDRLLDPHAGGRFSITPDRPFTVERRYRENSNVLEQVFTTGTGKARVTDSLNSGISGRLPWSELARRVEGLEGIVDFDIEVRAGDLLRKATPWREDSLHGEVVHLDGVISALRTDGAVKRIAADDSGMRARLRVSAGERATLGILAGKDAPLILPPMSDIDRRIDRSDQAWKEWAGNLLPIPPYEAEVLRSALALKLLLFSPTGAIAAAATTSLPERIGGDKNYDYRFAWTRDVAFTIKAFLRVNATEEAEAAFAWLTRAMRLNGDKMATMYTLDGEVAPDQVELDLPGYRGSRPVLQGNRARSQLQLGCYGDLMEVAALFVEEGHVLDLSTRALLARQADVCADIWRQPDSGIWELEEHAQYTTSKVGCWSALNRAVSLAEQGQIDGSRVDRWRRERDRVLEYIETECWSEARGSYVIHSGSDGLDAALALAARFGFPNKDRLLSSMHAIVDELGAGPHVYRYTGMQAEEGAFTACGFWMVEALAMLGERAQAVTRMEGLIADCCSNLGLLNEQFDPATREHLGNVPQALSHLALIQAACALHAGE